MSFRVALVPVRWSRRKWVQLTSTKPYIQTVICTYMSWDLPCQFIGTQWCHIGMQILVNIGLGNGLVPDGTKPLPQPRLTYHQWGLLAFSWGQFHRNCCRYHSLQCIWKLHFWKSYYITLGPMSLCVSGMYHHWFSKWLVICLVAGRYTYREAVFLSDTNSWISKSCNSH